MPQPGDIIRPSLPHSSHLISRPKQGPRPKDRRSAKGLRQGLMRNSTVNLRHRESLCAEGELIIHSSPTCRVTFCQAAKNCALCGMVKVDDTLEEPDMIELALVPLVNTQIFRSIMQLRPSGLPTCSLNELMRPFVSWLHPSLTDGVESQSCNI